MWFAGQLSGIAFRGISFGILETRTELAALSHASTSVRCDLFSDPAQRTGDRLIRACV